jgi:hypothetical protein
MQANFLRVYLLKVTYDKKGVFTDIKYIESGQR